MRVACLKRAKLRHCNLRCSNMAGTDLGESDMSGCNLQVWTSHVEITTAHLCGTIVLRSFP
eukprot:m.125240 g.125240  ORF g.125240 m.125240 type:complete len:61 (-) comp15613_c0_seq4:80-262(-)